MTEWSSAQTSLMLSEPGRTGILDLVADHLGRSQRRTGPQTPLSNKKLKQITCNKQIKGIYKVTSNFREILPMHRRGQVQQNVMSPNRDPKSSEIGS